MNASITFVISHHSGPCSLTVVVKAKAAPAVCFEAINNVVQACGGDIAPVYEKFKQRDEFRFGEEHAVLQLLASCVSSICITFCSPGDHKIIDIKGAGTRPRTNFCLVARDLYLRNYC